MSNYTIKKGALGTVIQYECPKCHAPLTSSFSKAGEQDNCPDCGTVFKIPGEVEKAEAERRAESKREALINDQERKRREAEEAKHRLEEQRKLRDQAIVLANVSTSPPPINGRTSSPFGQRSVSSSKRQRGLGDRILEFSFSVARGFSVVTIVFSAVLFTLVLCASIIAFLWKRDVDAPPLEPPTLAEYQAYKSEAKSDEPKVSLDDMLVETNQKKLKEFISKHRLGLDDLTYLREMSTELDWLSFDDYLKSLDQFMSSAGAKVADESLFWFSVHYLKRYRERQADLEADREFNERMSQRSGWMLMAALYLFIGLMSFIAFPLLIRIERNTRQHLTSA